MKKITYNILLILAIITLTGCKSCPHSQSSFGENLDLFERSKTSILKNTVEKNKKIEKIEIQKIVSSSDYEILEKLSIDHVYKINNALVFTFITPYDKSWLDKKFQKSLNSCITHMLFSADPDEKNEILAFPQYAECRYDLENIENNWTYIFQKWYCAD